VTVAYFDTSALLQLFVTEPGSTTARTAWQAGGTIVSARLLYAEARAALAAAHRDPARAFAGAELAQARQALEGAWRRMVKVDASEAIITTAGDLAERQALRGYDAVHLASALYARADALVSADGDLIRAAPACGLAVVDTRR
jgi:predicted nucleic acid-binding protein